MCVWVVSFYFFQTYNVDRQVPDSAGTATALFSGVKANYYMVGLDATASFNVCQPEIQNKAKVRTLIDWAIEAGKSTGKSFRLQKQYISLSHTIILWGPSSSRGRTRIKTQSCNSPANTNQFRYKTSSSTHSLLATFVWSKHPCGEPACVRTSVYTTIGICSKGTMVIGA